MSSKITEPLPGPFFKDSIELTWAEYVWDEPDQGDDWDGEVMMARWLGYAAPDQVLELKRLTGDGAEDMSYFNELFSDQKTLASACGFWTDVLLSVARTRLLQHAFSGQHCLGLFNVVSGFAGSADFAHMVSVA